MKGSKVNLTLGLICLGFILSGCGGGDSSSSTATSPAPAPAPIAASPTGAGMPINVMSGIAIPAPPLSTKQISNLAASKDFHSRTDPFSLTASEKNYDQAQFALNQVGQNGNMEMFYEAPPENQDVAPQLQAQPYRRLSGILVGNSVLAIIDMGDGQPPRIVSPGEMVPDSEWRVVSIDQDQAVLRRGGNVLPHEITVPLEEAPLGVSNSGAGAAGGPPPGAAGGPPPGSVPGGPPPGLPGVPGG